MSKYAILLEIERLDKSNIRKVTTKDLSRSMGITEQAVRHSLKVLLKEEKIVRTIVQTQKGVVCYYMLKKNDTTEGFINAVLKTAARIIP